MVTWNCTSCLSAAVVVLLSDYLKWDFLVQMCILDTVTSNPGVLLSPYASRPPQLFKFQDTWLKQTHAWSLQKWLGWQEKSDHTMRVQNAATNWYNRSLQLPYARYCLGITSSNACFSHPPLKNGNAIETSRRRNVPTSRCAAGLSALLPAVPQGLRVSGWRRACTPHCAFLLTLENLQLILPVQWLHVEEGERLCCNLWEN